VFIIDDMIVETKSQTQSASSSSRSQSSPVNVKGPKLQRTGLYEPIDGDSISGSSIVDRLTPITTRNRRYTHSPGTGGFTGTPLCLYARNRANELNKTPPLLETELVQSHLPHNSDLLRLFISFTERSSPNSGVLRSWMSEVEIGTQAGLVRLIAGLSFILNGMSLNGTPYSCALTWTDIQYLRATSTKLSALGELTAEIRYLISVILEDAAQKDLSLKFRLENVLDFNDQITSRGWVDGGRKSVGTHTEELREWFASECQKVGIEIQSLSTRENHDLSPIKRMDSDTINDHDRLRLHHHSVTDPDPFAFDISEQVLGNAHSQRNHAKFRSVQTDPLDRDEQVGGEILREIVVVDVQTDHALRRHINKATELKRQFAGDREYIEELRKYIQRRLFFETNDTKGSVFRIAKSREGFVHIGDIRNGASSRHFAILFKTLCDATGVYCRLVRGSDDGYYNVVMISEVPNQIEDTDENRRESNQSRDVSRSDPVDTDEELEDVPEELVPIFWEPNRTGPQKRVKLSHPLDVLLQECNSAADPVDLDEFFNFDKLLGKGSFGEVWKVELKSRAARKNAGSGYDTNESVLAPGHARSGPFALKLIPPAESDKDEASFMRIYSHARIIRVIAVFRGYQVLENRKREMEKKPAMCILMDIADKCLESVLAGTYTGLSGSSQNGTSQGSPPRKLDMRFSMRILIDAARAMVYLHSPIGQRPHLVHRDLKPGNILITSDSRAIVTDFGVARMNPSLETNLTVGAGTEGYMAPEQKTLLYDRPADVYSFGVIIARMLGISKWKDATHLRMEEFETMKCDPVLSSLCLKCVQASPLHRPSFEQILQVLLSDFVRREFSRHVISIAGESRLDGECRNPHTTDELGYQKKSSRLVGVKRRMNRSNRG
jgi:serine/threonine protein kinase